MTAYPAVNPQARTVAFANLSSVFVLMGLPGMRALERGAGDDAYWAGLTTRPFVVEVSDALGRFLPFSFTAALPNRGILQWGCAGAFSPPAADPPLGAVPLFSSPTRDDLSSGVQAVVRADLWDTTTQAPAAWAVVEASFAGVLVARGLAGADGRLLLVLPYPEAAASGQGPSLSPTGPADPPLTQQTWTLSLAVRYAAKPTVPAFVDLCQALTQPLAHAWSDTAATTPLTTATVAFGKELILRSIDVATSTPLSTVLLTPA